MTVAPAGPGAAAEFGIATDRRAVAHLLARRLAPARRFVGWLCHESGTHLPYGARSLADRISVTIRPALAVAAALALASVLPATAASGQTPIQPAVLYDIGGKFDKSRNEAVASGIAQFARANGVEFREFEVTTETQREQALRNMARRGDDPILAAGPANAPALQRVAAEFPGTRFAIIDAVVNLPNVQSIVFRDEEGAFIVGVLAALSSRTGKVGFVGGMEVPRVRRTACGFVQGVKYGNANATVLQNMTGTTPAAWTDPIKGAELAKAQFDRGVDVVFHAAAGTGLGVLQAAADAGRLGIGHEFNQNGLHPGSILTSMIRRVDLATFNVFKTAADGTWQPGILSLGIKERGIDWALDENNAGLVPEASRNLMNQIKTGISNGNIKVADYTKAGKCPA